MMISGEFTNVVRDTYIRIEDPEFHLQMSKLNKRIRYHKVRAHSALSANRQGLVDYHFSIIRSLKEKREKLKGQYIEQIGIVVRL